LSHQGIKSIVVNAGYLLGAHGIAVLCRGVYAIALAHLLGPEIYGLFTYGMSWYLAFLPLTYLGLNSIMAREVGRDRKRGGALIGQALGLRVVVTLGAAAACAAGGWLVEDAPAMRWALAVFAVALVGRGLAIWATGVFTAYEASRYAFGQQGLFRVVETVIGVGVVLAGGGLLGVATVHAVTWWLQAAMSVALIHRHLTPVRLGWDNRVIGKLLRKGIPIGLLTVLEGWLVQGPLVLFRHGGGTENSLGQLALAMQALFILGGVGAVLGASGLPVLSRAVMRGDGKEHLFADGMLRAGLLFGAVAGLAGMALGPWVVALIFGERYAEAGRLLGPVLWLLIPLMWSSALLPVLFARGRAWPAAAWAAAGALVMSVSLPALASSHGAPGAVLAAGIGLAVGAVGLVVVLAKDGDLALARTILRPALAVVGALGCYLALEATGVWVAFAASLAVLFIATVALGVVSREEWSSMRDLAAKWR